MKYTLEVYGREGYFLATKITPQTHQKILDYLKKNDKSLSEVSEWELSQAAGEDLSQGDFLTLSKPLDNGQLSFILKGESDNILIRFEQKNLGDIYDHFEDLDSDEAYIDVSPNPDEIVFMCVHESKGGICTIEFEGDSEYEPQPLDFSVSTGVVETPSGDWDYIDKFFFFDKELQVSDYLDNTGKSSTIEIWKG